MAKQTNRPTVVDIALQLKLKIEQQSQTIKQWWSLVILKDKQFLTHNKRKKNNGLRNTTVYLCLLSKLCV